MTQGGEDEEASKAPVRSPSGEARPAPGEWPRRLDVWAARLDRVRRLMPRFVYFWISGRIHGRMSDEWHWRNVDDRDNDRGIPPEDEKLAWHGVWVVEAFLPSTVDALAAGVRRLGWWEEHRAETIEQSIESGRSGRGRGWVALPGLRRRTRRGVFRMPNYDRELPRGVEFVTGHIHYVTPSYTAFVVGFRFDESVSAELDALLRRRYRTYHEMLGWYGHRVMSPDFQRRDAVRALEKEVIDGCRAWLARYFPGHFATGADSAVAPATLLLTTEKVVPFERDEGAHWMQLAGISYAYERWDTGITGLRYAQRPKEDGVPVLAGRQSDLFSDPKHFERTGQEPSMWFLMHEVDYLGDLLTLLAAGAVLVDTRRRLGRLRDSLAIRSTASPQRLLSAARSQLGTMSSDLTALTGEMIGWADNLDDVLHDVPNISVVGRPDTDPEPLAKRYVKWLVSEARSVREFEGATRSLLIAAAQIANALASMRVQLLALCVSVLALVVALVALAVSAGLVAIPAPNAAT